VEIREGGAYDGVRVPCTMKRETKMRGGRVII